MMRLFIYISFLLAFTNGFGQQLDVDFSLTTNQNKIYIGNPIQVHLLFNYPSSLSESVIGFPVISDSSDIGEHFEIWQIEAPQKKMQEDNLGNVRMLYEQKFTITSFDSGRFDLGPISAFVGNDTIFSNIASIMAQPVEVDTAQDIKDIKQLSVDPLSSWEKFVIWFQKNWYWPTGILVAILCTFFYLKWRKRKPEEIEIIPEIPLSITLLEKLDAIDKEELWQNKKEKLYYSKVTDILRTFIENRFEVPAHEKTSAEILASLKLKSLKKEQYIVLEKLFGLSDMVKFAKSHPSSAENEEAMEIAKMFILSTRIDINEKKQNDQ